MPGDHDLGAAVRQVADDRVDVEGLVGDQTTKFDAFDQRGHANRIVALIRQQEKTDEDPQSVGQGSLSGILCEGS